MNGTISGVDRWWEADGKSVYEETSYSSGLKHGPHRRWAAGRLERGHPRFFVEGNSVSKREYLHLARALPSIPPYRPEDDRPERPPPPAFIELKAMARRLVKIESPPPRWSRG